MSPHADFMCLSKKCLTDQGSPVYDLPVGAVRCPVCGSKRIRRLYNAVNVTSNPAQPIIDQHVEHQHEHYSGIKERARRFNKVEEESRAFHAAAAHGMVGGDGRYVSQSYFAGSQLRSPNGKQISYIDPRQAAEARTTPVLTMMQGRGPTPRFEKR